MKDHKTNKYNQGESINVEDLTDRQRKEQLERERVTQDYKRNSYKLQTARQVG